MHDSLTESISYKAVCRTAPATLGLLMIYEYYNIYLISDIGRYIYWLN